MLTVEPVPFGMMTGGWGGQARISALDVALSASG